jgi:aspyridone synthetase trans-acting enoyl reductase
MAPIHVPDTQHALKVEGPGAVNLDESCPVPAPQADEVLVRVVCVGLNPFDWKALDMSPAPGATWGCDMAGEVLVVGSGVNDFAVGDRVAGAVPGNNPDEPTSGAFAQYVSAPASMLFRIPSKMSFEEAATLGCGMLTVGLSLHHVLQLPLPYSEPSRSGSKPYVLVYGGGTATGTLAIQVARL